MCQLCAVSREPSSGFVFPSQKAGIDVLLAPWQTAAGSNEDVGVYIDLPVNSLEYGIWTELFERIDKLLDKDFTFTSFQNSDISVAHTTLPSDQLGNADYLDGGRDNGVFDIGMDTNAIRDEIDASSGDYADFYETIAEHELGHALGLKHPFDSFFGTLPTADLDTETIMSYAYPNSITDFDMAALIEVNGVEDDLVGGETPVHRFFNKVNGGHFFTASSGEAEFVATELYDFFSYEGTGFYAGDDSGGNNTQAVYRFYNEIAGGHFFTASIGERDFVLSVLSDSFRYEGIGFYAATSENASSDPVYRFYNESSGGHFFTADLGERNFVINALSDSFTYEGIGFYA